MRGKKRKLMTDHRQVMVWARKQVNNLSFTTDGITRALALAYLEGAMDAFQDDSEDFQAIVQGRKGGKR